MLQVRRYWQPSASLHVPAHPVKEATFAIAVKNGLECLNGAMPHEFCSCIRNEAHKVVGNPQISALAWAYQPWCV